MTRKVAERYKNCRRTMAIKDAASYLFRAGWSEYPMSKYRHRFAVLRWRWWLPVIERRKLAVGPYDGFHCWWGPFHVWDVICHDGQRHNGGGWR